MCHKTLVKKTETLQVVTYKVKIDVHFHSCFVIDLM